MLAEFLLHVASKSFELNLTPMNLADPIDHWARTTPDGIAITAGGSNTTWLRLANRITRAAARLQGEWGVRAGDRVAYLGFNRAEELVLLFALARLGAVFVPLNYRLAAAELAAIVAHAGARLMLVDADHRGLAADVQARIDVDAEIVLCELITLIEAPCPHRASLPNLADDAPVLLAYTSGTTGAPKGALHTHRGVLANARASIAAHALCEEDCVLTVLPLFHVGGLCIQTLPALVAGARVVLHARFEAGAWLNDVKTLRPTLSLMVPATLRAVIEHPNWDTTDLSSLRALMAGSSTIPRALIDAVHARGIPLCQIYGATETGPVSVVLKAADAMRKAGYAGWPAEGVAIRLIDANAVEVAEGVVGEIVVRAPNLMRGYWRGTDEASGGTGFMTDSAGPWFRTGDLARRDADGCIEVVGRLRDLIISGGENIYPAELENVLAGIAGVAEATVVGVPDAKWGEVPVAFVVREANAAGASLAEATVLARFDGRLARFKHPKRVVFVDTLPKNAMGKVQKSLLRETIVADSDSIANMFALGF